MFINNDYNNDDNDNDHNKLILCFVFFSLLALQKTLENKVVVVFWRKPKRKYPLSIGNKGEKTIRNFPERRKKGKMNRYLWPMA